MAREGKFWIDPAGVVHAVATSHEEWAGERRGKSLEALLRGGWIRVQAFPGKYLLVDHLLTAVRPVQGPALESFFLAPGGLPIPYGRLVVERDGEEGEFGEGQNAAALEFARGRAGG
jgi:hypothetical protein